jgi:hypothetical protein
MNSQIDHPLLMGYKTITCRMFLSSVKKVERTADISLAPLGSPIEVDILAYTRFLGPGLMESGIVELSTMLYIMQL